jgi:hypothetical protein
MLEGVQTAVRFQTGSPNIEIGSAGFLHSFFSTISHLLEPEGWSNRFPLLMNRLYAGHCFGGVLSRPWQKPMSFVTSDGYDMLEV